MKTLNKNETSGALTVLESGLNAQGNPIERSWVFVSPADAAKQRVDFAVELDKPANAALKAALDLAEADAALLDAKG